MQALVSRSLPSFPRKLSHPDSGTQHPDSSSATKRRAPAFSCLLCDATEAWDGLA